MINDIIYKVKQDRKLYEYLKYHSYWYSILTYDPNSIKQMINEMKKELRDTVEDKIEDFTKKIEMISSLLEVLS